MNTSNFSAAARKEYAGQLKRGGSLRNQALDQYQQKRKTTEQLVIQEHAEAKVGSQYLDEFAELNREYHEQERALSALGFDVDRDGEISLTYDAPYNLRELVSNEVERRIGKTATIAERFDNAYMAMLTAQNLDDAEKVMKQIRELIN